MFCHISELAGKPSNDNFWVCNLGHSEGTMPGDQVINEDNDSGKLILLRVEPCKECGGLMKMIRRADIQLKNTWGS